MVSRTFDEMDRMFEQMDRMFEDMRARLGGRGDDYAYGSLGSSLTHDWRETDESYTLIVDLPGFEKDELDVHAVPDEGVVVIDAEHEVEGETEIRSRRVHERFSLPEGADVEESGASYRNGVLELSFGRRTDDASTGHRIDID